MYLLFLCLENNFKFAISKKWYNYNLKQLKVMRELWSFIRDRINDSFLFILMFVLGFGIISRREKLKITGFTTLFMMAMVVLSFFFFTNIFKELNPECDNITYKAVKNAVLKDGVKTDAKEIGSIRKGDELALLCYTAGNYQVQTPSGERGWVRYDAIDGEIALWLPQQSEELEAATLLQTVSINEKAEITAKTEDGKTLELSSYEIIPTKALGLRTEGYDKFLFNGKIRVTDDWIQEKFAKGTPFDEISEKYYGYAALIDNQDDYTVVTYPYEIKDYDARKKYSGVNVKFVNGKVDSYEYIGKEKMSLFEKQVLFTRELAGNDLVVKMRSAPFTSQAKITTLGELQRKNKENIDIPAIIGILIAIAVFVIELFIYAVVYISIFGSILLLPMVLAHYLCYVKFIPNYICGLFMSVALIASYIFIYTVYFPNLFFLIIMTFAAIGHLFAISSWLTYHRCKKCKTMYHIEWTGESGHRKSYYSEIRTVKEAGSGKVVSSTSEDYVDTDYNDHYECTACGYKFVEHRSETERR